MSPGPVRTVSAAELRRMLGDGGELALLDVREEGAFFKSHLLLAVNLPLSRLELRLAGLVPRRDTRIVLCDADDGLAERAAERMAGFGYSDVAILDGGVAAWSAAGHELFSGINVPSKAFGEFVEHVYGTPSVSAEELKAMLDAGEKLVVLDSRPMDEFNLMNIPTGICCPGGELVHRVHDLAPTPDTMVVVNCAGRTRSIIGAQSLINAGLRNRVVALRNGTMGWHLAGLTLEHGNRRHAPEPSAEAQAKARAAAEAVAKRFGVRRIDRDGLRAWQDEAGRRTLYLFDVRSPEEYAAGHLPGAVSAPGGQLVQATDRWAAVRNARIVLTDDSGVRAIMTAHWLLQMGWDVSVLEGGLPAEGLETGARPASVLGLDAAAAEEISPQALKERLEREGTVVIDLADSRRYRKGHVPGAWWAVRSRLDVAHRRLWASEMYVLTSEDGVLARLAAPELARLTQTPVRVLAGGTAAWTAAGFDLAEGRENMADEADDVALRPYDRDEGVEDAMRDYLSWEIDLVHQIERDGTLRFQAFA